MRIAYSVKDICDYVGATTAKCQVSLYGRWCDLTINVYCLGENPLDATAVACSYGIRPLDSRELLCSSFDGVQNGMLRLSRGTGGNRQNFDQELQFPTLTGTFFDKQTVADGGVPVARNLIRGILRGAESMVETIRQTIRCSFPDDIRDFALKQLDDKYGAVTVRTLRSLFGEIHWRLMLAKSGCDDQQFDCIEFMAANNPPRFYDVNFDGDSDIPLVGEKPGDVVKGMQDFVRLAQAERRRAEEYQAQLQRDKDMAEANGKARSLLESICGPKLAREFDSCGYITIKQEGYTFEIPANAFIRCTDPNGKRANLCIHSLSFQVNPIDEIVTAYLHIRHNLSAYMGEAIPHGAEKGFQKMPKNT